MADNKIVFTPCDCPEMTHLAKAQLAIADLSAGLTDMLWQHKVDEHMLVKPADLSCAAGLDELP